MKCVLNVFLLLSLCFVTVLPVKGFGQTLKKEKITYLSRNIFGFENMFGDVRLGQPE